MEKRRKTKTRQRNEQIKKEFYNMTSKKHLKSSYAIKRLADKYFLTENTVQNIVYEVGHYKVISNQLSLF